MTDLRLDPLTNDLIYTDGDLVTVADDPDARTADETRQRVEFVLRTQLGEWSFDTAFGIPYLEEILIKDFDLDQIKARLIGILGAVPGVTAVLELNVLAPDSNRLSRITGRVDTRGGEADFAVTV
jgi:hypothetical protein